MNFLTVITLYPAVTMVYEYFMNDAGAEKAACKSTCHGLKSERGYTRASGTEVTLMNNIISEASVCVDAGASKARRPSQRVRSRFIAPIIDCVLSSIPKMGIFAFLEGEVRERQRKPRPASYRVLLILLSF